MTTNDMSIHWLWPYAAVAAVLVAAVLVAVIAIFRGRRRPPRDGMPVYGLDDDLNTEHASHLFHLWRLLGRIAVAALVAALAICTVLIARPAHVDRDAERSISRDIVLCLDVSGSALPYDRAVIETYLELVSHFQGERIGPEHLQLDIAHGVPPDRRLRPGLQPADQGGGRAPWRRIAGRHRQDERQGLPKDRRLAGRHAEPQELDITDRGRAGQLRRDDTRLRLWRHVRRRTAAPRLDRARHRQRGVRTPTYSLAQALDMAEASHISVDGLFSGHARARATPQPPR